MKPNTTFSDEMINAYVDGELSTEDELSILNAMQENSELLNRVNELKRTKLLVRTTYSFAEPEEKIIKNISRKNLSLVASFILTFGILGGWLSHDYFQENSFTTTELVDNKNDNWNIVLHVNSDKGFVQKTILDETESLLASFKNSRKKVKVEIVAYGKGVYLFDSNKSKYKERLASLKHEYSNLSYAVCGQTIKRFDKNQKKKIQLISNLTVARSGLYQIIKRQKQGWNYIRI